jgi:HTH-type transcriptional regulator/antitoxin MqsA
MADKEICPICEEGHLEQFIDKNPVEYKGHTTELNSHYSVCDTCGCEQTNATQMRNNKRAMLAFKKEVDGLLTGEEIRRIRLLLGITQNEAATIFGGGTVAFSKYENNDVAQSVSMDKLLRVVNEVPEAFHVLAKKVGIDRKLAVQT